MNQNCRLINQKFTALTLWAFTGFFLLSSCAVSPKQQGPEKTLVTDEEEVFDKRFTKIAVSDLDLKRFWVDGVPSSNREVVPINNKTFANVLDRVRDGVVNIYTLRLEERNVQFGLSPNDLLPMKIPIFSSLIEIIPWKVPIPFRSKGISLGSGFIINKEGYVLTNAHVVHNATDIRVILAGENKEEIPAKIIGMDRLTDTALLKMEVNFPLSFLPLGYSDEIRVGEMVIAIGNPLGLNHTITSGLISATDRFIPGDKSSVVDFIQTDSAINPGSSGGPLINMYGEVIGINTAIIAQAQLVGFAIPIDTVKEIMPLLVAGKTERGWFGVAASPLQIKDAVNLGYPKTKGILVRAVAKESPAEKSGLKANDIIVKMNHQDMDSFTLFRRKLLGMMPGMKIDLTVFREGERIDLSGVLMDQPDKKK